MANASGTPLRRRPVFIANFRSTGQDTLSGDADDYTPVEEEIRGTDLTGHVLPTQLRLARTGLRYAFPEAGPVAEGGNSDGYRYRVPFAAGKMAATYELIKSFLSEQGYGDVPIPDTVEELRRFRLPPKLRHQLSLFGEDGYVHNPVKILFPTPSGRRGELVLELFNEREPGHLLKFHRR